MIANSNLPIPAPPAVFFHALNGGATFLSTETKS